MSKYTKEEGRKKTIRDRYKRMVKRYYLAGHSVRECAEYAKCSIVYAQRIIDNWQVGERRETGSHYDLPTYQPELNPSPFYDNHDDYSRHWAGAEKEDDRHEDLRGLDWPIKQKR